MANEKSIFKKLACPSCRRWEPDGTGKATGKCPKCGTAMSLSGKWHVRLTRQGKTIVRAISTRKQDAVDYIHAAKDAIRRGQLLPGEEEEFTWAEAKQEFEKWVSSPAADLAAKTQEFYNGCLSHLDQYFTGSTLQSITVRQVESYRDSRKASPKTVAEEIKTLKRIYSLFCRWHSARIAPGLHAVAADLAGVEIPKINNKRTRYLTDKEITLLLGKCEQPHLHLAVTISLRTGLRLGNVMGLQWRKVDFESRTITFDAADMKSGRDFVLPVMASVIDALQAWKKSRKKLSPYVFPSPRDLTKPMLKMQTSFEAAVTAAKLGEDVCFHTLRHTFASHFLMNGGDLATLSELLDHSSIQVTKDRYGHLSGEHKKKAIDAFEKSAVTHLATHKKKKAVNT